MPSPIRSFLNLLALAAMIGVLLWREHTWQLKVKATTPAPAAPASPAYGTAADASAEKRIALLQEANALMQKNLVATEARASALTLEVQELKQAIEAAKPEPTPDELAAQFKEQRGLAFEPPPAWQRTTLDTILDKIRQSVETQLPPDSAAIRSRAALAMGYHQDPFDYREGLISLFQMTNGGFYEAPSHQFFFREEASLARADGREAFIGGLSIALAQRQAGSARGNLLDSPNDDSALALRSLINGDANASRVRFSIADQQRLNFNQSGAPTIPPPNYSAPAYLAEMWKFSQDKGSLFVESAAAKGGNEAVNAAYQRPPQSSAEILHPDELYFANPPFQPVPVDLPAAEIAGLKPFFSNVAGELGTYVTLRAWLGIDEATPASEGWAGDRYQVWPGEEGIGDHLYWKTIWRTEKDAREFFDMQRRVLMQRFSIPWRSQYDATPDQFSVNDPRRIIRLILNPATKTVTLQNSTDPTFAQALSQAAQSW